MKDQFKVNIILILKTLYDQRPQPARFNDQVVKDLIGQGSSEEKLVAFY